MPNSTTVGGTELWIVSCNAMLDGALPRPVHLVAVDTWISLALAGCAAVALLWWLNGPSRHESVPWAEVSDLLSRLFNEMRVGAWAEVAPKGRHWVARLERRRGWRKHVLFDVRTTCERNVLDEFCKGRKLRWRPRDSGTVRVRVLRSEAVQVAQDLIEKVLVESDVAPGAAIDVRCWGRSNPQAMRPILKALAGETPIRRGGNLYRRKLSELDERLERGDD